MGEQPWQPGQPRRGPGWQLIRHTSRLGASRLHIVRYDVADAELVEQLTWHVRPDHQTFHAAASVPVRFVELYGEHTTMHQMIMGQGPGQIGHINGDGLDNRRANLAPMTHAQIMAKRRPPRKKGGSPTASPYKGVTWDKAQRKWQATFRGTKLGRFLDEEKAARAYDDAAYAHWGRLAYLNFPDRYPPPDEPSSP